MGDPDGAHRPALRRRRGRRLLGLRRVRRRHRHRDRGADQPVPDARQADARQGRHQRRDAAQPDQQPRRLAARLRHRRGRLPADLRRRARTRSSTTTRSRTAARSPTPTSASRTSRASAPSVVPAVLGLPTDVPAVAAGTAAAANVVPSRSRTRGDAPLTITASRSPAATPRRAAARSARASAAGDFPVVGNTLAPRSPRPSRRRRATCVVNVGFKPTQHEHTSVARLTVTSNADDATESVLLVGHEHRRRAPAASAATSRRALAEPDARRAGSFGAFVPATARTYDDGRRGHGRQHRRQRDAVGHRPEHDRPGPPGQRHVRAAAAAAGPRAPTRPTRPAFAPLSKTAGAPTTLLTYTGPTAGADTVTLGFRQAIGADDVLRAGTYSKTLTFTLSTHHAVVTTQGSIPRSAGRQAGAPCYLRSIDAQVVAIARARRCCSPGCGDDKRRRRRRAATPRRPTEADGRARRSRATRRASRTTTARRIEHADGDAERHRGRVPPAAEAGRGRARRDDHADRRPTSASGS